MAAAWTRGRGCVQWGGAGPSLSGDAQTNGCTSMCSWVPQLTSLADSRRSVSSLEGRQGLEYRGAGRDPRAHNVAAAGVGNDGADGAGCVARHLVHRSDAA